jgi:hypothetical protein
MTTIENLQRIMTINMSLLDDGENLPHLYSQRIHHMLMFYSGFFFGGDTDIRTNPYGDYGIKVDVFSSSQNNPENWSPKFLNIFEKIYKHKNKEQLSREGYMFNYINDLTFAMDTDRLKFGYASDGESLRKVAFFHDGIVLPDEVDNEEVVTLKVFDPISNILEYKPVWYIGCSVDIEILARCIIDGKHPLNFLGGVIQDRHNATTAIFDY